MSKNVSAGDTAWKILRLLSAAVILAAVINLIHPDRIAWVEDRSGWPEAVAVSEHLPLVQLSDMIRFLRDDSRLFVDARSAEVYRQGHIPGAVSVPAGSPDPEKLDLLKKSARPPVVYSGGTDCMLAVRLAQRLHRSGQTRVSVFIGGMSRWRSEMLAVEETLQ